jgi:hypothetical protein
VLGPTSPFGRLAVWQQQVSSVDREPGQLALGDRTPETGQGAGARPPPSHNTGRTDHVSGVSRHLKRYCRYYGLRCCMAIPHLTMPVVAKWQACSPPRVMRATFMQFPSDLRGGLACKYWAAPLWAHLPKPPRLHPLPVRRTSTLPAAAFGFRIAPGTLAVRLSLPLAGCGRDFTPESPPPPPRGRG